mmetsp:Transcript_21538/g.61340  ORF Transcript_21538/g.61340 Transcript_21538/m.61340 type:complete len:585 (-) Transcript_21538:224-1978(-)
MNGNAASGHGPTAANPPGGVTGGDDAEMESRMSPSASMNLTYSYQPSWESLDKRPPPQWYDEAKFGIFIHWGVFSVPAFVSEWFWHRWKVENNEAVKDFMAKNYPPGFTYAEFAPQFRAEFFDANGWADLLAKSGARYVVLTSKHHEGYTLWPSAQSWNWNSVDVGPHRDLVKDLMNAVRNRTSLRFGLYFSHLEWFNPLYMGDKAGAFKATRDYPRDVSHPQLYDLVKRYRPHIVWGDGQWEAPEEYWGNCEFVAWLYNESPVREEVVINDRWSSDTTNRHGGFYTGSDKFHPGHVIDHKWENAMTLDKNSWGYRREAKMEDLLTTKELIYKLASTVAYGGNLLLNIGPTADGRIDFYFQQRLLEMGHWLSLNGEAIYGTYPWLIQTDNFTTDVFYTSRTKCPLPHQQPPLPQQQQQSSPPTPTPSSSSPPSPMAPPQVPKSDLPTRIYAIFFAWPTDVPPVLRLQAPPQVGMDVSSVSLLGHSGSVTHRLSSFSRDGTPINLLEVTLPTLPPDTPLHHGWALQIDSDKGAGEREPSPERQGEEGPSSDAQGTVMRGSVGRFSDRMSIESGGEGGPWGRQMVA